MEFYKIIESLHPLERKVLPKIRDGTGIGELTKATNLSEVEVSRALSWLAAKGLVSIKETEENVIELDSNGMTYQDKGLPELRLIRAIKSKPKTVEQLKSELALSDEEISISIGALKKKAAAEINKTAKGLAISATLQGVKLAEKGMAEQDFLNGKFPLNPNALKDGEKLAFENLARRKNILKVTRMKLRTISLTAAGRKAAVSKLAEKISDRVTPEMLKKGSWEGVRFRRFDLQAKVPRIYAGKKQPYRKFLDDVRKHFVALGFEEMTGPLVETDFWNMDALFMPQFHSARDIHDAYYVKEPSHSKDIPNSLIQKVREAHEKGVAGSRGWRYKFDVERTTQHLLRTQGTACSARMLASKELKIPGKYFAIARCFRHDVIDATHLVDFNQTEGIVVEEGLNFRHLISLLKTFAREFAGADRIKVVPAYFPFTEPSASLYAKHPEMGWIELGGSGIFRPEMTRPLGVNVPVIAWGIGIDRIAMFKLGVKDIRQLFSHDLEYLRNAKMV